MLIVKANIKLKQNYKEDYIKYGFTCLQKDGEDIPQCVLCTNMLANSCLKPFQLKQHLNNVHKEQASKSIEYFKSKEGCHKHVRLDTGGTFHQANFSIVEASYVVALHIANEKKSYTIAMTVKLCLLDCAKIVLD